MVGEEQAATDVTVVIVSYHCREQVLRCVRSIRSLATSLRLQVIVVDNASVDGTVEALTEMAPDVQVVPMGMNSGFSKANNVGIAKARGRHVLVLNPDTVVSDGSIDRLAEWLDSNPKAGVAAPRLMNPDGTDQGTARSFPTPSAALFGRRSPITRWFPRNRWSTRFLSGRSHKGDSPFRSDWVSGAAMMVPVSAIDEVGAFDEDYFLFWEDADWCRRLVDAGYEVWTVPDAVITHHEGGTRAQAWSPRLVRNFHRGAYLYWRKHHAPQPWNPARWIAAVVLIGRGAAVTANEVRHARRGRLARSSGGAIALALLAVGILKFSQTKGRQENR